MTKDNIDLAGSKILIVDDQPLSIKLMEALLNQKGFDTTSANNGLDALKYLEDNTPDLVMLDVMMPGMSGFEVSMKMRENPQTADIPVIFVTARDDADTISKCFEAGGNDYAAKPLRIYELLARVKLALTSSLHKKRARASEEALEESKTFLKKIIDENPAQIFVMNADSKFLLTNNKFTDYLALTSEQIIGKSTTDFEGDPVRSLILRNLIKDSQKALSEQQSKHSFEMPFTDSDGIDHWLLCTRLPFIFHHEKCVLGINLDFSNLKHAEIEKKKLEEQLVQSQKMEVIGTLAGGIAHDFNNMLAVILGYTDLAKNTLPKEAKQINHLNEVTKAGTRAKDLVKQILNFSRQTEIQHTDISITVIAKEVIKMIKSTLPSNVEFTSNIDPETPFVRGDQTQMHQVIMNLCVNANQAMPDGGTLTLSMTRFNRDACTFAIPPELDGDYVHISIQDTGMGMDESVQKRIFEPYFTTKEIGKGTGMGLAVVHGIINQHSGNISVESTIGKGTTFHILLPSCEKAMEKTEAGQSVSYFGKERILIVDDEPMVGELVKETLNLQGYETTLFKDSTEALEHFTAKPNGFDLILSDYMMPNMTGDKLAIEIRKVNAEVPIILATGYSNNITREAALQLGITDFLMKPIVGDELCKAVRLCLEGQVASDQTKP
ncbi:MAG: response regulator [Lentisphaeraceae bacterium]|nr:response regulator [Lentisphaeraceae bacterium]